MHMLPCCTYFTNPCLKDLPHAPRLHTLNLSNNRIESLDGISSLPMTLTVLDLRGNPVAFTDNYRAKVFQRLPRLAELDGLLRQPDDVADLDESKGCCLC